ncbi:Fe-S cluster assembly ATPase SufC [Candidatus Aquarickettsia rohweri]|uniref:Fe-S cluster assembly ATPase SufC n=1 Tax=Candidatus Aquarickettsia rohweri TaxID=2602574 RepID=A0A3R9XVN2_9RICK|nr:Fe-S cluster assembly ATPase SufC [Candidatus Aquarickettsia rohweri]RST66955.1 Fe-S cluster assembly ATPase SufC [Candidatus Aquarickettsia rohweri]
MLLEISNLSASADNKKILNNLNLSIKKGEVHAIMGPNGTGKSTLANVISVKDGYDITNGSIKLSSKDLSQITSDERARMGIFMSFQHPIEIPGVSWNSFLKASINSIRKDQGKDDINTVDFLKELKEKANLLDIDFKLLKRDVNYGFSGGEKKKFEILQMLMLKPKLIILDEIDSGLDVDALKVISKNINEYKNKDTSIIVITHYNRLLDYVVPDFVHIFSSGTIIKSGDKKLAKEIEMKGYDSFK